jgi:hypothetical protein
MRKTVIACLAVVLVLAGGLIALLGPRHCPVNEAAFERIEKGMTPTEVEAILGGPQGDYRTRPPHPSPPPAACSFEYDIVEGEPSPAVGRWRGDEGVAVVCYAAGIVEERAFFRAPPHSPGLVELARWRLGKWWEELIP